LRTGSIIAHDEYCSLRDKNRAEISPTVTRCYDRWVKVRLNEKLATNPYLTTPHFNFFATDRNNPLDEIALGRATYLMKDDDIAAIWVMEAVRDLVHKHSVTGFERRVHRRSFNDTVSEQKRSNSKGNDQSNDHYKSPVKEGLGASTESGEARRTARPVIAICFYGEGFFLISVAHNRG